MILNKPKAANLTFEGHRAVHPPSPRFAGKHYQEASLALIGLLPRPFIPPEEDHLKDFKWDA